MTKTPITGDGLASLSNVSTLETLILDGSKITDSGLKQITKCKYLVDLSLRETAIAGNVPELKDFLSLARLDVSQTRVNDFMLKHLGQVKTLSTLTYSDRAFSSQGFKLLQQQLPECRLMVTNPPIKTPAPKTPTTELKPIRVPVFTD